MTVRDPWVHTVASMESANTANAGTFQINTEDLERAQNTITFHAGNANEEMLKIGKDGFWVRGVKVEQDDREAEKVYNAFRAWMVWAELGRR
jgi:2-hydroxychromene-2-carboxylate isomerase